MDEIRDKAYDAVEKRRESVREEERQLAEKLTQINESLEEAAALNQQAIDLLSDPVFAQFAGERQTLPLYDEAYYRGYQKQIASLRTSYASLADAQADLLQDTVPVLDDGFRISGSLTDRQKSDALRKLKDLLHTLREKADRWEQDLQSVLDDRGEKERLREEAWKRLEAAKASAVKEAEQQMQQALKQTGIDEVMTAAGKKKISEMGVEDAYAYLDQTLREKNPRYELQRSFDELWANFQTYHLNRRYLSAEHPKITLERNDESAEPLDEEKENAVKATLRVWKSLMRTIRRQAGGRKGSAVCE